MKNQNKHSQFVSGLEVVCIAGPITDSVMRFKSKPKLEDTFSKQTRFNKKMELNSYPIVSNINFKITNLRLKKINENRTTTDASKQGFESLFKSNSKVLSFLLERWNILQKKFIFLTILCVSIEIPKKLKDFNVFSFLLLLNKHRHPNLCGWLKGKNSKNLVFPHLNGCKVSGSTIALTKTFFSFEKVQLWNKLSKGGKIFSSK